MPIYIAKNNSGKYSGNPLHEATVSAHVQVLCTSRTIFHRFLFFMWFKEALVAPCSVL